jgi:cellulose synthase operon protein YhjQ
MFKIAIVSVAGGVGRTTLTASLATLLAQRAIAVLALEFDPQNLLGTLLGSEAAGDGGLLPDFVAGKHFGTSALVNSDRVAFLPFGRAEDAGLLAFEQALGADSAWLQKRVDRIDYPPGAFLLIDTPHFPCVYSRQAIAGADLVLAVLAPDARSFELLPTMEAATKKCAPDCRLVYVMNCLDSTRELQNEWLARCKSMLRSRLSPYVLHRDEAIPRALAMRANLLECCADSLVAHDLNGLLNWLLAGPAGSVGAEVSI